VKQCFEGIALGKALAGRGIEELFDRGRIVEGLRKLGWEEIQQFLI
jgi:hypothetical protein